MISSPIHRFNKQGTAYDIGYIIKRQPQWEKEITDNMREEGYVPVLDLTPHLDTRYNRDKEHFEYELTIYGMYVGTRKAWQHDGILGWELLPTTPRSKSKTSSNR